MNSCYQNDYTYKRTKTESNKKIRINKRLYKKLDNPRKFSPFSNIQIHDNFNKTNQNYYNSYSSNKYYETDYSFSSLNNTENLFLKKKGKNINKSFNIFDNSFITNNNKNINENNYYSNINKSFINYESKIDNNFKNFNIRNDFKINKIIENNNQNNKLKTKFENLLDLALKNEENKNKSFLYLKNNIDSKRFHRMEMTIERIRNKNRKEIFKKKIDLNIPRKRITNKNFRASKKNLSMKLLEKLNKSQTYKSINYKENMLYHDKRNKSFITSFIHLNNDINYKRKNLNNDNSFKMILNTQNIYRPNSIIDYNKKIIEKENTEPNIKNYNNKNESKMKYKLKYLRADLNFFKFK